jgi:hypothetical protein
MDSMLCLTDFTEQEVLVSLLKNWCSPEHLHARIFFSNVISIPKKVHAVFY